MYSPVPDYINSEPIHSHTRETTSMIRDVTAYLIAPIMAKTGFRFGKEYRWGITWKHRLVYRYVSTIRANFIADELSY